MLLLTGTSDLIQVVTGQAVTTDVHASWVDNASGTITPGRTNTAISGATTTTVVGSPGASTQRNVQTLVVRNKHASSSVTITVQHTDGVTPVELVKLTLAAGEELQYIDGSGWAVLDTNGALKVTEAGAIATQADMESGSSLTSFVTPGSHNITSIADTGTGVVTITIATDFSGTTYACVAQVQATATTSAVANARECHIRSATIAVGSVALDCIDNTGTTNLVKDPTTWHMAAF